MGTDEDEDGWTAQLQFKEVYNHTPIEQAVSTEERGIWKQAGLYDKHGTLHYYFPIWKNVKKAQIIYYTLWNCRCGKENES